MWGNVFSERPEAVKCSNFLGGHFVFLKGCEFCTEAIEMPGVNTFSGGCAPKTTGFCTVICILQFRNILALFDKVMVSEVCMLPNGNYRG